MTYFIPADAGDRLGGLVERQFRAGAPNALWIADVAYVATWSGFAYAAFVTDVFSRLRGWRVTNHLRAELAASRTPIVSAHRIRTNDRLARIGDACMMSCCGILPPPRR
jgi:transposase InsO family protein